MFSLENNYVVEQTYLYILITITVIYYYMGIEIYVWYNGEINFVSQRVRYQFSHVKCAVWTFNQNVFHYSENLSYKRFDWLTFSYLHLFAGSVRVRVRVRAFSPIFTDVYSDPS
jgi:hypothetical protein